MKLFRFSKNRKKRRLAAILAACLFVTSFSGCGKEAEQVPELMEPLAATEVYRPVVRGSIGDIYILNGIIVPEKYPVYTEKTFEIASINVCAGDYVNEGDVIATGNTKSYDRQLTDLNNSLNLLRLQRSTTEKISIKNEEILSYKKQACEAVGYDEEAAGYEKAILVERENRRYSLATLDAQMRQLNKQITDVSDDKSKLVFTAPHSGYISFVKDLSDTNQVEGSENIAVVADYDDLHIEVPTVPYNKYLFKNYEEKYTIQNGQKFEITEYEYDPKELGYADTLATYPPIRFNLGGIKAEMGSMVPLYFKRFSHSDVLMVGKDSIYQDNEVNYVYIKNDEGQRERRDIEIGATDSLNYEVKSGLKEGDLVFYENMSPLPVNYTEHEITLGDYEEIFESDTAKKMFTDADIYISECKGTIKNLAFVSSGSDVGEGQELIRIGTDPQTGEIADLKNQLADLNTSYNDTVKALDEREKADREAIDAEIELPEEPLPPNPEDYMNKGRNTNPGDPANPPEPGAIGTVLPAVDGQKSSEKIEDDHVPIDVNPSALEGEMATVSDAQKQPEPEEPKEPDLTENAQYMAALAQYELEKKQYTDAVRDSMFVKEIAEADLEIIAANRSVQAKSYEDRKNKINEELSEYQKAGSGVDVVYTGRRSGKSGKVNISTNTSVSNGQYLFTVMTEGKKLLKIVMKKETDPSKPEGGVAKIGQTVEISINGKVYYGKCVGENGNCETTSGLYLFSRNGSEHLTTSKAYAEGGASQFFVQMDDEEVYDMIPDSPAEADDVKLNVQFRGSEIHGATVVPVKGLYNEKDQANAAAGKEDRYYVWKITDQGLVKQYVILYKTTVISENKLVLSGLSEGDKIAIEGN